MALRIVVVVMSCTTPCLAARTPVSALMLPQHSRAARFTWQPITSSAQTAPKFSGFTSPFQRAASYTPEVAKRITLPEKKMTRRDYLPTRQIWFDLIAAQPVRGG
jgi:hypothetical protein